MGGEAKKHWFGQTGKKEIHRSDGRVYGGGKKKLGNRVRHSTLLRIHSDTR